MTLLQSLISMHLTVGICYANIERVTVTVTESQSDGTTLMFETFTCSSGMQMRSCRLHLKHPRTSKMAVHVYVGVCCTFSCKLLTADEAGHQRSEVEITLGFEGVKKQFKVPGQHVQELLMCMACCNIFRCLVLFNANPWMSAKIMCNDACIFIYLPSFGVCIVFWIFNGFMHST